MNNRSDPSRKVNTRTCVRRMYSCENISPSDLPIYFSDPQFKRCRCSTTDWEYLMLHIRSSFRYVVMYTVLMMMNGSFCSLVASFRSPFIYSIYLFICVCVFIIIIIIFCQHVQFDCDKEIRVTRREKDFEWLECELADEVLSIRCICNAVQIFYLVMYVHLTDDIPNRLCRCQESLSSHCH